MAVWARENTREDLFSSMRRKEVYATTGTRIRVRVFGGWDFQPVDVTTPDFAAKGYRNGVPMGGDLRNPPKGKSTYLHGPRTTRPGRRQPGSYPDYQRVVGQQGQDP